MFVLFLVVHKIVFSGQLFLNHVETGLVEEGKLF